MGDSESTARYTLKEVVMPLTLLLMTTIFSWFQAEGSKDQERIKACAGIISGLSDKPEERPKTIGLYHLLKRYDPLAAEPLVPWFAKVSLDYTVSLVQEGKKQEADDFAKTLPPELVRQTESSGIGAKLVDKASAIVWQKKGWNHLALGEVAEAEKAFAQSDKAYPKFQDSFEVSNYLKQNRDRLKNDATRAEATRDLVENHSFTAPAAMKRMLDMK